MNYPNLFLVTLPETALEIAALMVLVVDLGFLRKSKLQTRVASAAMLGVLGCCASLLALLVQPDAGLIAPGGDLLLSPFGYSTAAQIAILGLTVLTLFLFIGEDFTRHAGEYVSVVLMAATGGLLIAAAQDVSAYLISVRCKI